MEIIPIKTGRIGRGDDLVDRILNGATSSGVALRDGDVLAVAHKVVSVVEGRAIDLTTVKPSGKAEKIAAEHQMDPRFVEVVLMEADEILGGVYRTLLTIKDGIMIANAGADLSNSPRDWVTLWPEKPSSSAERIRKGIEAKTRKKIATVIIDSRTTPLRLGTTGLAIGTAGLNPIKDYRGRTDLFGKRLLVTTQSIADDLASAAHLVMGEANEERPAAIIRGAPIEAEAHQDPEIAKMPKRRCLYMKVLDDYMQRKK